MKLSICIPTYNRSHHLNNCLNSIVIAQKNLKYKPQICISNNCSTDSTKALVKEYEYLLEIKYQENTSNIGHARNFLSVVAMADGDFVWLIGDDDLLLPDGISRLYKLIDDNNSVDFFYVNSFHLPAEYLNKFPHPFSTFDLPKNMEPFSKWKNDGKLPFLDLVNPKISFDFLGGMFLSVFRKKIWMDNFRVLCEDNLQDSRTFSNFDNTFPHIKIFAKGFSSSIAYFNSSPLNVCLGGAREWFPMYPLIHSVRLVEALEEYRKNGMPLLRYIAYKNFALNNFIPDLINMALNKNKSGYNYINPFRLVFESFFYPNLYLSFFYFFGRRIRRLFNNY